MKKTTKKDSWKLSVRLTDELNKQIKARSEELGESPSVVARMALREYFLAREGAQAALDSQRMGIENTDC
jgi:predicted transcriptional regulator